jgi:hypothetical protein
VNRNRNSAPEWATIGVPAALHRAPSTGFCLQCYANLLYFRHPKKIALVYGTGPCPGRGARLRARAIPMLAVMAGIGMRALLPVIRRVPVMGGRLFCHVAPARICGDERSCGRGTRGLRQSLQHQVAQGMRHAGHNDDVGAIPGDQQADGPVAGAIVTSSFGC